MTTIQPRVFTIATPLLAVLGVFARIAESNARVHEFEHLNALSDAELARRGLRRDMLAPHVFSTAA